MAIGNRGLFTNGIKGLFVIYAMVNDSRIG